MKKLLIVFLLASSLILPAQALDKSGKCKAITDIVQNNMKENDLPSNMHNNRKYSQLSNAEIQEGYDASLAECMQLEDQQVDMSYQFREHITVQPNR